MNQPLLELPTNILLEKFGAGNHKPGSGSAAALQAMLAAQLICTVSSLTLEPKRKMTYEARISEIEKNREDIVERILPRLSELFTEDSAYFDLAILKRQERDKACNFDERRALEARAIDAMIPATELPLELAELCSQLVIYANTIFEFGFKSARGDSAVALSASASAMAGCLAIIDLNLLSFSPNDWTRATSKTVATMRKNMVTYNEKVTRALDALNLEVIEKESLHQAIAKVKTVKQNAKNLTNSQIENLVVDLQRTIWTHRKNIWRKDISNQPLDMLDPKKIIRVIGYDFIEQETLGSYREKGTVHEVAGTVNNDKQCIEISKKFPLNVQKFTAAHELGHAIMHEHGVLHRDRPLEGNTSSIERDSLEAQADKFAAYFLMPKKLVCNTFRTLFLCEKFVLNEETAFALTGGSLHKLSKECQSLRALTRKLSSAKRYNMNSFSSLAKRFGVSVEAMAIRLEELDLVCY